MMRNPPPPGQRTTEEDDVERGTCCVLCSLLAELCRVEFGLAWQWLRHCTLAN